MQPSTDRPTGEAKGRALRRYAPIVAIVVLLAIVAGTLVATRGNDDEEEASGPAASTGEVAEGVISFEQAQEEDLDVEFGEGCDTETGQVAIPFFFAPACYANVEGDNGGATARGVTADAIKVVVYRPIDDDPILNLFTGAVGVNDTGAESQETTENYTAMFQRYYQTYGRTVELEFLQASGNALDEVAARADAVRASEMEPFAVWGSPALTTAWTDEIAAREIICLSCFGEGLNEWYEERAPYVYGIGRLPDQAQLELVEYVEKKLVGQPAEHAGDPELQGEERVFGNAWLEITEDSVTLNDNLKERMEDIGAPLAESLPFTFDPGRLQEQADSLIAQFKEAGVTTVILGGDPVTPANFTQAATSQDFFPEWITTGVLADTTVFSRTYDQEQWSHAFGLTGGTVRIDPETVPAWFLHRWWTGEDPPAADTNQLLFPQPAVFFSALQQAGPDLTPETFRDGLFASEATPNVVTNPSLSWGDKGIWDYENDWNGVDDFTEIWWDPEATGLDEIRQEGQGMYQYVDGGRRYLPGEVTEDEPKLFDPKGAVDILEEPPEDERPPDYPSPAEK